jgi:triosephosphate isomerase
MAGRGRRPFLAANWKLNPLSRAAAVGLAEAVIPAARRYEARVEVALFPPFPWLVPVGAALDGTGIGLGAQDSYWEPAGAFTGEVSAAMLVGLCEWVIVGHSERRTLFGETDDIVARKAEAALAAGLRAIVSVGEREDQYLSGRTEPVVSRQLATVLASLGGADPARLVIAYEPVWAIGTGRNADPEHAGTTMALVRRGLAATFAADAAAQVRVLYGGSVKAANVRSYVSLEPCDGCLVGGASLQAEEFSAMIEAVA